MDILQAASISLLLRLILSHLLTDFLLQPDSKVKDKFENGWRSGWLYIHGLTAGALAYIFSGYYSLFWILPVVGLSHILIDGIKSKQEQNIQWFILDQILHLAVLLAVWYAIVQPLIDINEVTFLNNPGWWLICLSYFIVIWPSGILIGMLTKKWQDTLDDENSLPGAGMWIGMLERFLLLTFVLLGQFQAIGLLITAKSIFRFDHKNRATGEYILIGTLLSFALAVLIGIITKELLSTGSF